MVAFEDVMVEQTSLECAEAEFAVSVQEMRRATDRAHQALDTLRKIRAAIAAEEQRERAEMLRKARRFWGHSAREAA
jgi:hypothetical protein